MQNLKSNKTVVMDELLSVFPEKLLKLNHKEQNISLKIYELLCQGEPVSTQELAKAVSLPEKDVNTIIERWPGVFKNEEGNIIGYWGLALTEMSHIIQIDNKTLYNWCAWDSLFIPPLIDKTAQISSFCPITKQKIKLKVTKAGVELQPPSTVMSFVKPQSGIEFDENVITNFCHKIFYFCSEVAASSWVVKNSETFVISVEDAFRLGQKKNELQYRNTLRH